MVVRNVLLTGLLVSFLAYADQKSFDAGQSAVNTVQGFTSRGALNQNVYEPLKSKNVNLKTVNGQKQGVANISCPESSTPALEVTFSNLGNNEYGMIVKQSGAEVVNTNTGLGIKVDNQGTLSNYNGSIRISGVCGNGIVYCNPYNSWNVGTCNYFYWATDNSGRLILVQDNSRSKTGQCVCTNASCGYSTLFYQDIIGSISGVLSNANPKYAYSKGQWNDSTLTYTYYGTDFSNCSAASKGSMGITNGEQYYKSQTIPDASLQVAVYQNDTKSPYYSVLKSSNVAYKKDSSGSYTLSTPSGGNCEIRNGVNLVVNTNSYTGSYSYTICADHFAYAKLVDRGDGKYSIVLTGTGPGGDAGRNCGQGEWSIDFSIDLSGNKRVTGYVLQAQGTSGGGCYFYTSSTTSLNSNVLWAACPAPDEQYPGGNFSYRIDYSYETVSFNSSNSCSSYESKSDCRLDYEKVCDSKQSKCVETVVNGVRKNNVYLNSCNVLSGQLDSYLECDFLDKITVKASTTGQVWSSNVPAYVQRRYICSSQDVGIDLSRSQKTIESMNMSGNTATFNDPKNPKTQTINAPAFTNCIKKYCAVRYTDRSTQVYTDSSNANQVQGGTTRTYDKRECISSGSLTYNSSTNNLTYTCPVSAGEEKLVDCSCESDIDALAATAISTLGAIDEAVHDMICSQ